MLRIIIATSDTNPLRHLADSLGELPSIDVVDVCTTGQHAINAARGHPADALVFPPDWAETCRAMRLAGTVRSNVPPHLVLAAVEPATSLLVKAFLFGFDGVITSTDPPETLAAHLDRIVDGSEQLIDNKVFHGLGVRHGLLAQEIVIDEDDDKDLARLIGAGFPDDDIADLLGWSIQHVRNRIEHLLTLNGLKYRTQLAVVSSSVWRIPDFH